MQTAIIALTVKGRETARKIKKSLPGAKIFLASKIADGGEDALFTKPVRELLGEIFDTYQAVICIMATGIVVRAAAPYLKHKSTDPAVVVVDDGGKFAISLLSGHLGGANALAKQVAQILGGQAVITTASDNLGITSAEIWGKGYGLCLYDFTGLPQVNGAIISGGKVAVISDWEVPENARTLGFAENTAYFLAKEDSHVYEGRYAAYIYITDRLLYEMESPAIVLRPKTLVVGMGMKRGITAEHVYFSIDEACRTAGVAKESIKCITSIDAKADEEGLLKTAEKLQIPCMFFSKEKLQELVNEHKIATSQFVKRQMGVGAVCEPAALATAQESKLIYPKQTINGVTTAIARIPFTW